MTRSLKTEEQKLLVINFGGIGDEILFLPTLKTLREEFPHSHLTLLLEPRSRSVRELTDLVDEVLEFDIKKRPLMISDLLALLGLMREGNYQTVISSGSSPLVAILLFLSGIPRRIGYDSGPLSRKLLSRAVRLNRNQYAADMYHDLVQGLGLPSKPVVPEVLTPKHSLVSMEKFLAECEAKANVKPGLRLILHPGTSLLALQKGLIKTWSAECWAALIQRLLQLKELEIILAGGPDDAAIIGEIRQRLESETLSPSFFTAYGATKNLSDLAALIQLSDLLVCVDSAPMHIAVGLNKPLLALFGPTDHGKLLPPNANFKALSYDCVQNGRSLNNGTGNSGAPPESSSLEPSSPAAGKFVPGVQLPPDTVYHNVLIQLEKAKALKYSPGARS